MEYTIERVEGETPQYNLPNEHLHSEVVKGVERAGGLGKYSKKK